MAKYAHLSDADLRRRIHAWEQAGHTGRTCHELDMLNREQTNRLSGAEIVERIHARRLERKPVDKLVAAARGRGIDIPTESEVENNDDEGFYDELDEEGMAINASVRSQDLIDWYTNPAVTWNEDLEEEEDDPDPGYFYR